MPSGQAGPEDDKGDPPASILPGAKLWPRIAAARHTLATVGRLTNLKPTLARLSPRLSAPPKVAEAFYTSPEWRALIANIKRLRGAFCRRCGSTNRIIGDHIIERRDGGADLDPSNVELLCARCHAVKTAQARARRARAQT